MARSKSVNILVACLFLILALGLFNLEVIRGRGFKELSDKNSIRLLFQLGARGRIRDCEGNIIVDNKLSYDVMLLPQTLKGRQAKAIEDIANILSTSVKELKEKADSFRNSSLPVLLAKDVSIKNALSLEELRMDIPGIIIQARPQRSYPYATLASHVLGYVAEIDRWRLTKLEDYGYKTKDMVGFGGVEEKYDYYLRQEEGGFSFEVDHRGSFMRVLGFRQPESGKDIQLTLNLKIQKIAEDKLNGTKGCVIIMNPATGQIAAMASFPNFNPSLFNSKANRSFEGLFNNPDAPLINRAISASYPAGSIFKVIVAAAALETKKINLSTSFNCQGATSIGRQEFSCWGTHKYQSLISAIAHSCNVFFYRTGLLAGAQSIHDYALKFGLSKPASFDLPYEASGFIPSPLWRRINKLKNWYDGDTANLSIGQGDVLVTPLQMARITAVFANGGNLVTPYIVKYVGDKDASSYHKKIMRIPLKDETINYIRQGLRRVVTEPGGTANVLSDIGISVAGKTGTAQAPPGQPHAWFVGFFPYKEAKFVICVFLEKAGPGYYACVMAKQIITEMIKQGLI